MNFCQRYISTCEKRLPDPCHVKDLVNIGLYKSAQQAAYARKTHQGPEYMILPHGRVFYPKKAVIKYLKQSYIVTHNAQKFVECSERSYAVAC